MKTGQHTNQQKYIDTLFHTVACLESTEEARAFLTDLCTPSELDAMASRWAVIPLLKAGVAYRTIYEETGVSVATITRIARCLTSGEGGYELMYERGNKT